MFRRTGVPPGGEEDSSAVVDVDGGLFLGNRGWDAKIRRPGIRSSPFPEWGPAGTVVLRAWTR